MEVSPIYQFKDHERKHEDETDDRWEFEVCKQSFHIVFVICLNEYNCIQTSNYDDKHPMCASNCLISKLINALYQPIHTV